MTEGSSLVTLIQRTDLQATTFPSSTTSKRRKIETTTHFSEAICRSPLLQTDNPVAVLTPPLITNGFPMFHLAQNHRILTLLKIPASYVTPILDFPLGHQP
ncbi:hypothetical protein PM082_008942 [Marasmius tenuissimus]|nr:hypothetical protein PM082_008942 [Marasmius tenuissimus]